MAPLLRIGQGRNSLVPWRETVGSLRGSRISKSTLIPAGRLLGQVILLLGLWGLARVARVGFVGALPGVGNGKSLSGGHPMPAHT